jgi:hypothetical protein
VTLNDAYSLTNANPLVLTGLSPIKEVMGRDMRALTDTMIAAVAMLHGLTFITECEGPFCESAKTRTSAFDQRQPQLPPRHATLPSLSRKGTAASAARESNQATPKTAFAASPTKVMPAKYAHVAD